MADFFRVYEFSSTVASVICTLFSEGLDILIFDEPV